MKLDENKTSAGPTNIRPWFALAFPNSATFLSHFWVWTQAFKARLCVLAYKMIAVVLSAYHLNSPFDLFLLPRSFLSLTKLNFFAVHPSSSFPASLEAGLSQAGDIAGTPTKNCWLPWLDFVQVCGLSLNFYNNTLRKFLQIQWQSADLNKSNFAISGLTNQQTISPSANTQKSILSWKYKYIQNPWLSQPMAT